MASTQVSRQASELDGSNVPALSGTVSLSSSLHAKGGSHGGASSLASKIAAFSNGVAPVKSGLAPDPDDDELLIEEVMHKLEAAARVRGSRSLAARKQPTHGAVGACVSSRHAALDVHQLGGTGSSRC
jgi:hypothetical protein